MHAAQLRILRKFRMVTACFEKKNNNRLATFSLNKHQRERKTEKKLRHALRVNSFRLLLQPITVNTSGLYSVLLWNCATLCAHKFPITDLIRLFNDKWLILPKPNQMLMNDFKLFLVNRHQCCIPKTG